MSAYELLQVPSPTTLPLQIASKGDPPWLLFNPSEQYNVWISDSASFNVNQQQNNMVPIAPLGTMVITNVTDTFAQTDTHGITIQLQKSAAMSTTPSPSAIAEQIALKGINVNVTANQLSPSGDMVGLTDYNNIMGLLNLTNVCILGPGQFFFPISPPVVNSNQTFWGQGADATVLVGKALVGAPMTTILYVGESSVANHATVGNFQIFGNAYSGHGIVWRAGLSSLQNVTIQNITGDAIHSDASSISAGTFIDQDVMINIQVISPTGSGLYSDGHMVSSDFYGCAFDGQNGASPGGNIGVNVTGGNNLRFHGSHSYLWANGGVLFTGWGHGWNYGELESNAVADAIFTGADHCTLTGVSFYDFANSSPPSQHILFTGAASSNIDIGQCKYKVSTYVVPNFIQGAGSAANVHDCPGFNPVGSIAAPTYINGSPVPNPYPYKVRVFIIGSTGIAINGTGTGLGTGSIELAPTESVTATGAGGSWTWFGL